MKKILSSILLALAILAVACTPPAKCEPSQIIIAGECCDDNNNNSICDFTEQNDTGDNASAPIETNIAAAPATPTVTFEELKQEIYDAFYPQHRYTFELEEREDLTGIENTYDLYSADRGGWPYSPEPALFILKMKSEHNLQNTPEEFNEFAQRLYDLNVKNQNILAAEYIDVQALEDMNWNDVGYNYTHSREPISLAGKEGFIELHITQFIKPKDNFYGGDYTHKIMLPCTPELVVEVHPLSDTNLGWSGGVPSREVYATVLLESEREKKDMVPLAETISKICQGIMDSGEIPTEATVGFLGPGGFNPEEIHIQVGEKVLFYNEREDGLGMLILLQSQKTRKTEASKVIKIGEYWEVAFSEPGNYTYWNNQFRGKGVVIVE